MPVQQPALNKDTLRVIHHHYNFRCSSRDNGRISQGALRRWIGLFWKEIVGKASLMEDTLEAAQNDAEHQVTEKLKRKAQYAAWQAHQLGRHRQQHRSSRSAKVEKLEAMFWAIDETGNGMITEERLNALLSNSTHGCQMIRLHVAGSRCPCYAVSGTTTLLCYGMFPYAVRCGPVMLCAEQLMRRCMMHSSVMWYALRPAYLLRTVRAYLETLDLAVPEGTALFHILAPQLPNMLHV